MADYYTKFSVVMSLPSKEAQDYAINIHHQASQAYQSDDLPADLNEELQGALEDCCFEIETDENHAIWLHSENGGVDAACVFIQHLLKKFDPKGRVTFEWSNDCSKPRTDAYGGGAAIVTAKKIKSMTTGEWITKNTR
jgi:hypothetical protein